MRLTRLFLPLVAVAIVAGPADAQTNTATPPVVAPAAAASTPAAAPAPKQAAEDEPSLFAPTWRQVQIGGRFSSIDGDPARYQRYEDIRDGLLLTGFRYAGERAGTGQTYQLRADNVGWRDQRYSGRFEVPGKITFSGLWDQIPQFYSVDTKTAYSTTGAVLTLDDATQRAAQTGGGLNVWLPVSPQFDLKERRDIGAFGVRAVATPNLEITSSFKTQNHSGALPWGASFGFSNDVEIPLPYESRANDFNIGAEWNKGKNMLRVAYDGSWFDNRTQDVTWDSPIQLDDTTSKPGRGRMSTWPSNSAQTFSVAGLTKLPHKTQITGHMSFGSMTNDTTLQPFTINPTLTQLALPRETANATADVFSTNLSLVSRPMPDWRFSARFRDYSYTNNTPHGDIPQFINYDTSLKTSSTGGPEPYAHNRLTFQGDATWTGFAPMAFTVGYARNQNSYDFRIFENSGENVLTLTADAVGLPWGSARAEFEYGSRSGSGLDEDLLVQIGEQPDMRHYDLADRSRKKFTGHFDFVPTDALVLNAFLGFGKEDFNDSYFGLQRTGFQTVGFGADYQLPAGLGFGGSYTFERYTGFHNSRSASDDLQGADPARDWTTDSSEKVDYIAIYVTPPRIGQNTEARITYEYSHARANYVYGLAPNSPLTPPNQLPEAFNKLQDLRLDVRHRLTARFAATFSYRYEPLRIYDFAMDPTVVNSIVQPSSLVLGYVYRPYTANTFVVGVQYRF